MPRKCNLKKENEQDKAYQDRRRAEQTKYHPVRVPQGKKQQQGNK